MRGDDVSRIIGLSDGVFAFALTLIVIQLTVPAALCNAVPPNSPECSRALLGVLAADYSTFVLYAFIFGMIGLWWTLHHRLFRFIGKYDNEVVWLNLIFLLTIAVSPFVLGVFSAYPQTSTAVMLFAGTAATSGLLLAGIWDHAARRGLLTEEADATLVHYFRVRGLILPAFLLASLGVALVSVTAAEVTWLGGFVAVGLFRRFGVAGSEKSELV